MRTLVHDSRGQRTWAQMFERFVGNRGLTWRLFLRSFHARYRRGFTGHFLVLFATAASVGGFVFLRASKVLPIGETAIPYPLFVALNLTVWQLFAGGVKIAAGALVSESALVTKMAVPGESLVLATLGESVHAISLRLVLIAIGFAYFRIVPAATVVFVPFVLLLLFVFTVGIGFVLAIVACLMRDINQMLQMALTLWMFLTPVVYPSTQHSLGWINLVNPVAPLIVAIDDLTVRGTLTQPGAFLYAAAFAIVSLFVGWRVFAIATPRAIERI